VFEDLRGTNAYANSMRYFAPGEHGSALNQLLYLDMKTYLVELLMKQDQMSMASSIESRVPFLDHNLVEFAARVPLVTRHVCFQANICYAGPWRSSLPEKYSIVARRVSNPHSAVVATSIV